MVESSGPRSNGFFGVPGLFERLSLSSLRSCQPRSGLGLVDALTADAGSLLFSSIRSFLELGLPNKAAAACEKDAATTAKVAGHGGPPVVFTIEPFTNRPSAAPAPAGVVASGRCRCCMRRLPENRDIFIYMGEKAFCSGECREGYIEEDEDAQEITALDYGSSAAFFLGEDW